MRGTRQKTPLAISEVPRKRASWSGVTRCLNLTAQGPAALRSYRAAGHSPDSFANRREARACVAELLVRVEDELECTRGSNAVRACSQVRCLRRSLEVEAWP